MAKDWKKTRENKNGITYWSRRSGESLQIDKQKKISKSTPLWVVYSSRGINKGFNTKTKALTYAKAYMRKH